MAATTTMNAFYFTSKACGACRAMASTIASLQTAGFDITIIDAKQDKETSAQYKIDALPTLIIFSNTQEIKRWVGVVDEAEIRSIFKNDLDYRIW
jgi:thioredoxin-like negative regulator of GroEL